MRSGWPDLLRSIVDGKYFLKQFLEEDGDTGLFLAEAPNGSAVDVRLTPSRDDIQRAWAERVSLSAALAHPHLLREIGAGETRIDGKEYAYLASEHVQERLADVVASRTLTPDETNAVLEGALAALDHVHQRGYMHGKLTPPSIVAASDAVKLLTSAVRPLPSDELESRRAVTADLRELAETTTQMLTGRRELGAGAQLPSPFREFVRSSFGTEECPSPTAAQLLEVLHGKPLSAAKRIRSEEPSGPGIASVPVKPAVVPQAQQPLRFRPGMAMVLVAAVLVLAVTIAVYLSISGTAAGNDHPARTRTNDTPAVEPPRPSPVTRAQPPAAPAPPELRGRWAVVAAAYNSYDAAARRATQLGASWKDGTVTVFPEKGQGSRYLVVVGSAASQREAEHVRRRALSAGMPRDTYVTRLKF